jgi:6-phosphogluconolactonase
MKVSYLQDNLLLLGNISRRALLKGAAVIAAASAMPRSTPALGSILAYVGSYTPNGQGICLFSVDSLTGALTQIKVAATVPSPSWLAIHPQGKYLYAVNEISNFNGTTSGSVSAFSINTANGDLTFLNAMSSQGAGPAHLSVDPLGQYVFVANYGGGSVAVLPILMDGSLGSATDVQLDVGSVGPTQATDAPPGSFAISGHDAPHAHMIQPDPAGQFVFHADLGQDRIYSWTLNRGTGKLIANSPGFVNVPPGDGPRHFAFHPNGLWFYSLQEEASTLLFFDYTSGSLPQRQMVSILPPDFVGTSFASELHISQDGNFLYAANRLHDSIAIFHIRATGELRYVGEVWTRGDYPRNFNIDPTGSYLYSCNQRSDSVTVFSIGKGDKDDKHDNGGGNKLRFTGQYVPVGSPACIVFLSH